MRTNDSRRHQGGDTTDRIAPEPDDRDVRAVTEYLTVLDDVGPAEDAPGLYYVVSQSGENYLVDARTGACECPDAEYRNPEGGCKHVRRVEIARGERPVPAGVAPEDVDDQLGQHVDGTPRQVATDGGTVDVDDDLDVELVACPRLEGDETATTDVTVDGVHLSLLRDGIVHQATDRPYRPRDSVHERVRETVDGAGYTLLGYTDVEVALPVDDGRDAIKTATVTFTVEVTPTGDAATDGGEIIVAGDDAEVIDAGGDGDDVDGDLEDDRPDDCQCWDADLDLPCWPCYREGFEQPNPETPGAGD